MEKRFILRRVITMLLSIAMIAACLPVSAFAEEESQTADFSGTNLMNLESVEPSGYTTTTNPYGYDIGDPFLMVEQNELMYLNVWDNKVRQASYFDMGSENSLSAFAKNKSGGSDSFYASNYKLMEAVSFDPTGSGRRDHVAFVGISDDKKGYMWVIDTTKSGGTDCSPRVEIGNFSYMFDGNDFEVPTYSNRSFFNIVSGDFDGDGKESILIYTPENHFSDSDPGCQIQQWDYDGDRQTFTLCGKSKSLLQSYYVQNEWVDNASWKVNSRLYRKLGVSMAVGDFNGDYVDDLAVLSYCHRLPDDETKIDYYRPVVKIVYGTKGDGATSIVTKSAEQSEEFYTYTGKSGGRQCYNFPVGASLTCGDLDGDGDDDLFLAGMLGYFGTWKNDSSMVNNTITMDSSYIYVGKLTNNGKGFTKSMNLNKTVKSNGWTDGGYHDADDVWQRLAVESVAINGKGRGAKELVFLSGSLYDVSNDKPVEVYTGEYFKSSDDGAGSTTLISNCDIQSIAVGNFDGNSAGREQVIFTIALKHNKNNKSHLLTGYLRGTNYDDTTVEGSVTEYGTAGGYDCLVPTDSYVNTNAQNAVSFLVIPVDRDHDGVLAKYRGVSYAYTDPDVKAVLQAAPYFDEIMDAGNNETEYVLSESYELSDWDSDNVSFSVGYSTEFSVMDVVDVSIETGYALDWSKSFERSLHEEWSQSFSAQSYNSVVVSRTPVFIYEYDIQNQDGSWNDKTIMQTAIPQGPVYEQLSVDSYNTFVDEYNKYIADRNNEKTCYQLVKIDSAENWLDGNEGDPYRYNHDGWNDVNTNAKAISKSEFALGYNGTLDKVAWTKENTTTESVEMSHGFYFNTSIMYGTENAGKHGVSTSLQYSDGKGTSTSKGTAVGASCTVTSIDKQSLVAEGIPANVVDSYGFHWTLGQWQRHLSGEDGNKTPFIGYNITNLSSPAKAIDDLDGEITRGEESFDLTLSWTKPDVENGHPQIIGYYVYKKGEDGSYTKVSEKLSSDATSYTIESLDPSSNYTYVVTTVKTLDNKDYESVWSNEFNYRSDETPYIGGNGNWWVGGTDTGVKAAGTDGKNGKDGQTPYIGDNGNWYIGVTDTGVKAAGTDGVDGEKGENGEDGETPYIGENGNWWIGEEDTGVQAAGQDGKDGADGITPQMKIGEDKIWYVSYDNGTTWESLGIQATGEMGANGAKGEKGDQGEQGIQGIQGSQGVQGEKGDQGAKGDTGADGSAGKDGIDGTDGADGKNGTDGKDGADGKDGSDGKDGMDGTDGSGIDDASIDEDGYLILTMSDGTTINAGLVRENTAIEEVSHKTSTRALATAAVSLSCLSLLINLASFAAWVIRERKKKE